MPGFERQPGRLQVDAADDVVDPGLPQHQRRPLRDHVALQPHQHMVGKLSAPAEIDDLKILAGVEPVHFAVEALGIGRLPVRRPVPSVDEEPIAMTRMTRLCSIAWASPVKRGAETQPARSGRCRAPDRSDPALSRPTAPARPWRRRRRAQIAAGRDCLRNTAKSIRSGAPTRPRIQIRAQHRSPYTASSTTRHTRLTPCPLSRFPRWSELQIDVNRGRVLSPPAATRYSPGCPRTAIRCSRVPRRCSCDTGGRATLGPGVAHGEPCRETDVPHMTVMP